MNVEEAIYLQLNRADAINDVVSHRIYPLFMPQNGNLPALVYHRVSTRREYALTTNQTLTTARIQFDALADTLAEAVTVANALRATLDILTGAIPLYTRTVNDAETITEPSDDYGTILVSVGGHVTISTGHWIIELSSADTVTLCRTFLDNEMQMYDDDAELVRVVQDYLITFRE